MAVARVEFVKMKVSNNANILQQTFETAFSVDTGVSPATQPEAPRDYPFAIVTAITGNIIVDWGASPAAAAGRGHFMLEGTDQAFGVKAGDKLSIIAAV